MNVKRLQILAALVALALPAWADSSEARNENVEQAPAVHTSSSDIGWHGWGVRAGLADSADQFVGGAHFNLGELLEQVRFQPDVQLGVGDDVTTLYGTAPLYYRFDRGAGMTPYAGGGLTLGWVDRDLPAGASGDSSSFEVGARATGGLEWAKANGEAFFVELSLGLGDTHDAVVVAAWSF